MNANIQKMFLNWMSLIHDPTTNLYSAPTDYMADQQVELLGFDGNPIMKYKIVGAWPKSVGEVTLDYTSNDVAQFDVTFTYIYHATDIGSYGHPPQFAG